MRESNARHLPVEERLLLPALIRAIDQQLDEKRSPKDDKANQGYGDRHPLPLQDRENAKAEEHRAYE